MQLSMDKRENILWITNIILLCFTALDAKVLPAVIIWNINIWLMGNIKSFGADTSNPFIVFTRRILYFAVFLPVLFIEPDIIWITPGYYYLLPVSVILGIAMIMPKIKQLRLFLSFDFISMSNKIPAFDHFNYGLLNLLTPLGEELFYRLLFIRLFKDYFGISAIAVSALMFVLHHYTCKWGQNYSKYDLTMQLIFSLSVGTMFYFTDQFLPCVLAHITYNMPTIILNIKKYLYFYCNIGVKEENEDEDDFDI